MFTRLSSADNCKSILCCPVMAVDLFLKLDARAKLVHLYVSQQMADTVREWQGSFQWFAASFMTTASSDVRQTEKIKLMKM